MPRACKNPVPVKSRFINEFQAAEYLNFSVHTLRNQRAKGTGPRYAKLGGAVRYTYPWLDQ
jgi:hypothetical protein